MKLATWLVPVGILTTAAAFGGIYLSGSEFSKRYKALELQAQSVAELSLDTTRFEPSFFGTDVETRLQYRFDAETIELVVSSHVWHLPWGVSIDSGFDFSSDLVTKQQVVAEFGSSELLQATTSFNLFTGFDIELNSIDINNEKGHFSPICLQLSPDFNANSQLEGGTFAIFWGGVTLSSQQQDKQFDVDAVAVKGRFSRETGFSLWNSETQVTVGSLLFVDQSAKVALTDVAIGSQLGLTEQGYEIGLVIEAESSEVAQLGFNANLQQLALDVVLNQLDPAALSALNASNTQDLDDPNVKRAADALLSHGANLDLNRLRFIVDKGLVDAKLNLSLPAGMTTQQLNSLAGQDQLFDSLKAAGVAQFDRSLISSKTLGAFLFALKQQDFLNLAAQEPVATMDISLKEGVLTLNGKPVLL